MAAQGIVLQPGLATNSSTTPGRFYALKLLGGATGDSIMMFEETVPTGTKSTLHLHHDSDEVGYVLAGEITFMIGGEVTSAVLAPAPSCRAACRMPGRAPARRPERCCFSTLQPRPAG